MTRTIKGRRRFEFELLEQRIALTANTYLVNFQLSSAPIPNGHLPDFGEVFGNRGNGEIYGWSSDHTDVSRDREFGPDQRFDTLVHFHQFQDWEIQVPNGDYEVTVVIGDALYGSTHTLNVEGTNYWNAVPLVPNEFLQSTNTVTVADGRLTLDQGNASEKDTRVDFVYIQGLPPAGNNAPAAPVITEPVSGTIDVNPTDVHMEAAAYFDPDADSHFSSDWEIWTTGASAERVWFTLGITGVERRHTHLGDGFFENSHVGRFELFPDTDYELRVRFRDDQGSVSAYATSDFSTGSASTTFPLEAQDILQSPTPQWQTTNGADIDLLAGAAPPSIRVDTASEELLLLVEGSAAPGNTLTNPPPLSDHYDLRVVASGGTTGVFVAESDLSFHDEQGIERTICLPSLNVPANVERYFWVAIDGSTYYGSANQTEPDFSNLARECTSTINFIATQPNYVVEEVAGGFQLPVNVAFHPDPGPNPDDPAFYVTELYGTVKVVSNDGNVSDYATDLLNFNPTGNFPGSGEQGLAGIVVDPATGDIFVTRVTDTDGLPGGEHHPQVVRFSSLDGGKTAASETVILDMVGESQGQSHQISNISIGPDNRLYVHNGDGFDVSTAQNLNSYRGKILRMNFDGSAASDNPLYNAGNGITALDYIYAFGFRNPFGGSWRAADNQLYKVGNGPSVDRFARIDEGANYGWSGSNASMTVNAIYNWDPAHAPVNIAWVQPETFNGSMFPADKQDRAFVSESGPTYAQGPQARGKRIVEFSVDANGNLTGGPTPLVEYVGDGRATVVGLTAGPDGLYFTDLYRDLDAQSPIDAGARVLRVRYVSPTPDGDFDDDGDFDCEDIDALVAEIALGSGNPQFDMTGDGQVDLADRDAWLSNAGAANLPNSNPYLVGDANLDGIVDGLDFIAWNTNKFTNTAAWCSGDFTADGVVDGLDFIAWNGNKFQSSDFAADLWNSQTEFAAASTMTPYPAQVGQQRDVKTEFSANARDTYVYNLLQRSSRGSESAVAYAFSLPDLW